MGTTTESPVPQLREGQKAPEFELPDQNHRRHRMADYHGRRVLLYFYPADNTSGWTTEAVNFARSIGEYEKRGVVVLGLSTDSIESHQKFAAKFSLPFPLLADIHGVVCQLYGVAKASSKNNITARRVTFLIDMSGRIEKIWDPVKASEHNEQVLGYLGEKVS